VPGAIWPDEASLSPWQLPPDQLTTTLLALIEQGSGAVAYYADVREAVVFLAIAAPCGPCVKAAHPAASDFGSRMGAARLGQAVSDAAIVAVRRPLTWANAVTWPL